MNAQCRSIVACVLAALALGACSFAEEALWPSITNTRPVTESPQQQVVVGPMATNIAIVPAAEETEFSAPARTALADDLPPPGPQAQLWDDRLTAARADLDARNSQLQTLRATSRSALLSFQERSESITRRLLASTNPGDASLQADWGRSRADLDVVDEVIGQYESLSADNLAAETALSDLLTEIGSAPTAQDPRPAALAADTEKTLAVVQALSDALAQDNSALTARLEMAKLDLDAMAAAIPGGAFVGNALGQRAEGMAAAAPAGGGAKLVGRTDPLAVINFTDGSSVFEPALFTIVYAALSRRPNAGFDLVGVSPSQTEEVDDGVSEPVYTSRLDVGRTNAQRVRRALLSMGLPAERMTLDTASSAMAKGEEVHIYVR